MLKSFLYLTYGILLISLICSCKKDLSSVADAVDFGYDYYVIDPDSNVILKDDSLLVFVGYSGCKSPHHFDFHYYTTESEAKVWFKKIMPDEPCDMYISHWLRVKLPEEVLNKPKIVFLGPNKILVVLNSELYLSESGRYPRQGKYMDDHLKP